MMRTGVDAMRVSGPVANGDSGRNRTAPDSSPGYSITSAAAMIAPFEKATAIGGLAR